MYKIFSFVLVGFFIALLFSFDAFAQDEIKITASDGEHFDVFGRSVSISGDYTIVGADRGDVNGIETGAAYIFHFNDSTWVEQQKLTASDGDAGDEFGMSVSISGDYAIVGAPNDDDNGFNSGSTYIFHYDGSSWIGQDKLTASDGDTNDKFGSSVSISGNYAIVGVSQDDDHGNNSGSAFIFHYDGSTWVQQQKLTASDGAAGDLFGWSVVLSGDYAMVGVPNDSGNVDFSGSAFIFHFDGSNWVEQQKLTAGDGAGGDWFGQSVTISGESAIVGASSDDDNGNRSGSSYIFHFDGSTWLEQQKLTASDGAEDDEFGVSVAISGDNAIIGANRNDDNGTDSGSAYIFHFDGSNWLEQQKLTASDGASNDNFGGSVFITNKYTIAGALGADNNGISTGAAYIYPVASNIVAWSNALGGGFSNSSNWVGGEVPDDSQVALFDSSNYTSTRMGLSSIQNQPVTITFDDVTTTNGLSIEGGQVIFDLLAHSYGLANLTIGVEFANTPDEAQLEITNGVLGIDPEERPVLIGAGGFRGQLIVSTGGIFEVDTDDPAGLFVVGASGCGGGECGRLVIQNGGAVFTNASGQGSTEIGSSGGEGSVFISGIGEWHDQSQVRIGTDGGVGLLDIDHGSFVGNHLLVNNGIVRLRGKSALIAKVLDVGLQDTVDIIVSENSTVFINETFTIGIFGQGDVIIEDSSDFFVSQKMILGKFDTGLLTIRSGGEIRNSGEVILGEEQNSTGQALVHGDGSSWITEKETTIGLEGFGSLEVRNNATFKAKDDLVLGLSGGSEGTVEVSGSPTRFISEKAIIIGLEGSADFSITDGAVVSLFSLSFIGAADDGNGDLTVASRSFLLLDTLFIGFFGNGGLSVFSRAIVKGKSVVVGEELNSIGSILVDGDSTEMIVEETLRLGNRGTGFARVTNQGTLNASVIQIGPLGSIDASGGTLIIGGFPVLSPNSTLSTRSQTLVQEHNGLRNSLSSNRIHPKNSFVKTNLKQSSGIQIDTKQGSVMKIGESYTTGGAVYVDTLLISSGAQILADSVIFEEGGYLGGEGSFPFDVINSGGINPGDTLNTPGFFTIDANYTQLTNGTLFIELEGDLPGSGFDQLIITGDAQISGSLDVSALNVFEPQVGQTYEIVTAGNLTGTFDNIITHRGLGVSVAYNSSNIIITITSPVSVEDENNETVIPTEYNLAQNYPNPFNPVTKIRYSLPQLSEVTLTVYNILGQEVITLVNEQQPAGIYEVSFDAANLTSGIYLYKLQAGDPSAGSGQGFTEVKKMILLR